MREKNMLMDRSGMIRPGEGLDIKRLNEYLIKWPEFEEGVSIEQFPSGFSNLTYLIKSGAQEFVLRKPPVGANVKGGHDMKREYDLLTKINPVCPYSPRPVLHCANKEIIGDEFFIMERVRGIILRNAPPKNMPMTSELMHTISSHAVDILCDLHQLDLDKNNLWELGKPTGYAKRQVEGWIDRYNQSKTDQLASMEALSNWLLQHIPESKNVSLLHNDYKYDNLVLSLDNYSDILAVLDWEMATIGDPLMDLGTTLAYWVELLDPPALKTFNLTWVPGNLNRNEVIERYTEKTGIDTTNILFYYVFACFKLGVICQQIYARYKQGLTKDPRFAGLISVVNACAANGQKALNTGKISNY
ncbi:phosphotransferase family protein [Reichenbachiella carrageenanivorans]|uniref:Phosphotransferase family protein n=1 Tax=Reichenbachiella carrageenanivorans TaxID=2979869 RepID=A0ABY6D3U2_9BACT|nr:phosphotransferase family protein [Reichenbachiella carrageenanivorans]UXX78515.1 phosphotransferase family protein [Reichenbachiella carrageenanivorans]